MTHIRLLVLTTFLAVARSAHGQALELRLWGPAESPAADALAVERVRDVTYFKGDAADAFRHRLDLYLPKDKKLFPVVFLVHGGAWTMGDNRCLGLYTTVGEFLASRGIGVVMPNYRLSPSIKHPEHIKDVARAFAWARNNIAKHGGSPERLFVAGHSAGGHLVALLAADESYLKAEGLRTADIRGVIGVSGVYHLPDVDAKVSAGDAFHPDQLFPLRGDASKATPGRAEFSIKALDVKVYEAAFGRDPDVRIQASPVKHIRPDLPPFLLMTAEKDLPTLATMAEEFQRELKGKGNRAEWLRMEKRNHSSVMFSAIELQDPAARAILDFVRHGK